MSAQPAFLKLKDENGLIAAAAHAANAAYLAPDQPPAPEVEVVGVRSVNLYWWRNPTSARVTRSPLPDGTARYYVAFRGTIMTEAGNWVFANMQAFKTKFQGYPVEGEVHMGFYRAFHWLWSPLGREPRINKQHKKRRRKVAAKRAVGMIIFLTLVWVALVCSNRPLGDPLTDDDRILAIKLLVAFALLLSVEFGWAEKRFTLKRPRPQGIALRRRLTNVGEHDEVVFTGHSLGGAMAVHAFLMFRRLRPTVKSSLITFGAPRAGDQKWMDSVFRFTDGKDQLHIVNKGDPVPEVPGTITQAMKLAAGAGYLKAVFMLLGLGRWVWALLYHQTAPGDWDPKLVRRVGSLPLRFMKHPMATYGEELECNLKSPDWKEERKEVLLGVVGFVATTLLFTALVLGLLWVLIYF